MDDWFEQKCKPGTITLSVIVLAVVLVLGLLLHATANAEEWPGTVMRVVDGDTIIVFGEGGEERIRLIGVDCPEVSRNEKAERDAEEWGVTLDEITKSGLSAKRFVAAKIGGYELRSKIETGEKVSIVAHGIDYYGRTLAYIYLADGRCLNEILIRNGVALAKYSHIQSAAYREIEREAREARRGFWGTLWKNIPN